MVKFLCVLLNGLLMHAYLPLQQLPCSYVVKKLCKNDKHKLILRAFIHNIHKLKDFPVYGIIEYTVLHLCLPVSVTFVSLLKIS